MQHRSISSLLNSVSIWTTLLVPIVALLAFIPSAPFWVEGSKVLISGVLVTVGALTFVIAGFLEKRFSFPHVHVLLGIGLYALSVLCATLFVKGGQVSLFGIGIEAWTVTHIFVGLLFLMLVSVHAYDLKVRRKLVYILVFSTLISVVFQGIRIVSLGTFGDVSIFTDPVVNTLGRWSDFGIITLLLILTTIHIFALRAHTWVMQVIAGCVFFTAVTLFFVVSPLSGLILLAISGIFFQNILSLYEGISQIRKNIATRVLLVLAVFSLVIFVFQGITGRSPLFFESEHVPTLSQTGFDIAYRDFPETFITDSLTVFKSVVQESPVFGVGASRFQEAWAKYRPLGLNETVWWATDFGIGSGIFVTVGVMFGLLGLLGLGFFLFVVFRNIIQSLRSNNFEEKTIAFFALIIWIFSCIQTPSAGLMLVLLTLTGIVFSYKERQVVILRENSHKILAFLIAFFVLVLPVYGVWTRVLALNYVLRSEQILKKDPEDLARGQVLLEKALSLVPHEVYYQALAAAQQNVLSSLSTKIASQETPQKERAELSNVFNQQVNDTITTYTQSIAVNKQSYVNYFRRAQFLSNFLGQENDATIFATARADVKNAYELAPNNPTIDVLEAQLYLQKNNSEEAQKLLFRAIDKKANYTEAAIILSQLKIKEGNLQDALSAAQYAVQTNTYSAQALYIYGQLQFQAKNYLAASQAFERVLSVRGSIPIETGILLAQSYVQLGELAKAQETYKAVLEIDPNNSEIKQALNQLQQMQTKKDSSGIKK